METKEYQRFVQELSSAWKCVDQTLVSIISDPFLTNVQEELQTAKNISHQAYLNSQKEYQRSINRDPLSFSDRFPIVGPYGIRFSTGLR